MTRPMTRPLSRRTLLRGAGGVAIALPFLEAMAPRKARAADDAKRLFVFFTDGGVVPSGWFPKGTEKNFMLGASLAPVEPMKDKLIVFDGIEQVGEGGGGHQRGKSGCLTAQPNDGGRARGISIDQTVANKISMGRRFRSMIAGVRLHGDLRHAVFYTGPGQVVPPEDDPAKLFDLMFADGLPAGAGMTMPNPELAKLRARKKSILDRALLEYQRVSGTLGAADRMRLDAHVEAIRQVERGLEAGASGGAASASCALPIKSTASADDFHATARVQLDLLAMALACDLTRVVGIQYKTDLVTFPQVGVNKGHHALEHEQGSASADSQLVLIMKWFAMEFAALLTNLHGQSGEGGGTLLDRTLVYWTNELATGNHTLGRAPYIVATGKFPLPGGGTLQTGRFLNYPKGTLHSSVLTTVGNLMGLDIPNFGADKWHKGPLTGVF